MVSHRSDQSSLHCGADFSELQTPQKPLQDGKFDKILGCIFFFFLLIFLDKFSGVAAGRSEKKMIAIPFSLEMRKAHRRVASHAVDAGGKPLACRTLFVSKILVLEIIGSWHGNESISI